MSRSADVAIVVRRSTTLVVCGVAALVMLVTGHLGWGLLSGVVTLGGAKVWAGSLGALRSGKARAAILVPLVVTLIGLIAAF